MGAGAGRGRPARPGGRLEPRHLGRRREDEGRPVLALQAVGSPPAGRDGPFEGRHRPLFQPLQEQPVRLGEAHEGQRSRVHGEARPQVGEREEVLGAVGAQAVDRLLRLAEDPSGLVGAAGLAQGVREPARESYVLILVFSDVGVIERQSPLAGMGDPGLADGVVLAALAPVDGGQVLAQDGHGPAQLEVLGPQPRRGFREREGLLDHRAHLAPRRPRQAEHQVVERLGQPLQRVRVVRPFGGQAEPQLDAVPQQIERLLVGPRPAQGHREHVVGVGELLPVGRVVGVGCDQLAPDGDRAAEGRGGVLTLRRQVQRLAQPGPVLRIVRPLAEGLLVTLHGRPERRAGLGGAAEVAEDSPDPHPCGEQFRPERRVVGPLVEQALVEGQGRAEQLQPQRLEAGHVQQAALADDGERLVDRLAGGGEAGLGPLALGAGLAAGGLRQGALLGLVPAGLLGLTKRIQGVAGRPGLVLGQPAHLAGDDQRDDGDQRAAPPSAPRPSRRCPGFAWPSAGSAPTPSAAGPGSARRRGNVAGRPSARSAVGYRWAGSRSIAFWTMVTRSRGTSGFSRSSRVGSLVVTCLIRRVALLLVEGRPHRQQLVERQAQGIHVGAGVAPAVEGFGRHVPERAQDVAGVRQVLLVVRLGQAEIGHPDHPGGVQQEVRRLDVAMEHALGVGVLQGVGDLHADPGHALPVAGPLLAGRSSRPRHRTDDR